MTRVIDKQEYEVQWGNDRIFEFPRSKKERLQMLKDFVMMECGKTWATQNQKVSTLKKQLLRELINSIQT